MPTSRTFLQSHPLIAFGLVVLGASLACQPWLAARGRQQPSPAATSAEQQRIERLSQRASDRERALQAESDELASRERALLEEIRRLEVDRRDKTADLAAIDSDLADTTSQLEETTTRMADLEREADAQRPLVEARLVALYKMGAPRYTRLLFGANDLRSMGRASRLIASLVRRDRDQFEGHRQTLDDLGTLRGTLEAHQTEAASLQIGARAARRSLDRTLASQRARLEEIDARQDLTAELANELVAARQRLDAAVAGLGAGTSASTPSALSALTLTLGLPLRPFRGQIEPPVPGGVTVSFGESPAGDGIELTVTPGAPVHAIHEGTIAFAGGFDGLGTLVVVDHGDQAFSHYGYLASVAVEVGDHVEPRAELGTAGLSPAGDSTVFFELRIDGRPVDPVEWLRR
jgi:septal ring factor EnvC (AmiA/AmiB activator)